MASFVPYSVPARFCCRIVGQTVLQIGIQHTDNAILEKISRGHGVEETISALKLLKDNCFKVSQSVHVRHRLRAELGRALYSGQAQCD